MSQLVAEFERRLQHVERTLDVGVHVLLRREWATRLESSAQMQDHFPALGSGVYVRRAGEVPFDNFCSDRPHFLGLPIARPDESSDVVAVVQEAAGDVGTDSSGDSSNQHSHRVLPWLFS